MATSREKVLKAAAEKDKYPLPQDCEAIGWVTEPHCGDKLAIGFKTRREVITQIGYSLTDSACPPMFACASVLCEMALNKPVLAAYVIKSAAISEALGTDGGLDEQSVHCAIMAELALKRAIMDFSRKRSAELAAIAPESRNQLSE